ncbi:DDE-type integrase/transposase/recombinase [Leptotrichia massiliensis]|uniref:DDE-type integrase/transposase/recombinase n=1 Tax=Leptotrichia massiliensis TaxID=1852388 RepID=UPI0028D0BB39|nr:DDE-type integrase/transposase/recombinase [Leptotrichia massiliensis]
MKKHRKFGYEGLAEVYVKVRKEGYSRTYDSMCRIIREMKGGVKEKTKKPHKRKKKTEQAKYPGERVQIDIKYVPEECIQFGTRDQKYYQITVLDEYTRKRVLRIADEKSTYQTAKFLENLEKELGFDIKKIQTDNGKEFTNSESDKKTLFELKLEEKGIEYGITRPYSP